MEILDPTLYTCNCALCKVEIRADNKIPTIDIGSGIYILCERCFEALKTLCSNRSLKEISTIIGNKCDIFPIFDKFHPQHYKISHLTKSAEKTYTVCNCCGNMLQHTCHTSSNKEIHEIRNSLEDFKKKKSLEFDLCDTCLNVVTALESISVNENDFISKLAQCFKYPPIKK